MATAKAVVIVSSNGIATATAVGIAYVTAAVATTGMASATAAVTVTGMVFVTAAVLPL